MSCVQKQDSGRRGKSKTGPPRRLQLPCGDGRKFTISLRVEKVGFNMGRFQDSPETKKNLRKEKIVSKCFTYSFVL